MEQKSVLRFVGIVAAFGLLIVGYIFFSEQSLLVSGKNNAESIAQQIEDGDQEAVKTRLAEFVGTPFAIPDSEYDQALASIDYAASAVSGEPQLEFVGGELVDGDNGPIYGAAFALPAPQGGEDYLLITLRRENESWVLANTQLAATNPFDDR